jgi:hypothetical protein
MQYVFIFQLMILISWKFFWLVKHLFRFNNCSSSHFLFKSSFYSQKSYWNCPDLYSSILVKIRIKFALDQGNPFNAILKHKNKQKILINSNPDNWNGLSKMRTQKDFIWINNFFNFDQPYPHPSSNSKYFLWQ